MEIPKEVKKVVEVLENNEFQAYIVGGCVRDLLLDKKPKDWDIATDAKPEEIEKLFSNFYSNNEFGTVTVITDSEDSTLKEIEITPFRIEEKYTDKRHPDQVEWAQSIEEDLGRRDFTINAMAMKLKNKKIVDPFEGQKDLKKELIKAVGNPEDRFNEDALRMMRAIRFCAVLNFEIEEETSKAIENNAPWLRAISKERIRDEFMKIIMADEAHKGVELLRELKLLKFIIPELLEGYGVSQNKHHVYGCYEHAIRSLKYAAEQNYNEDVRLASLLHDVGKPRVKEGEGKDSTFYNHEIVGAETTAEILQRLRFPKKKIEKIVKLVRYHLFYYHPDEVTESSVRKLVRSVGPENMDELIQVRKADRIGSGCPKAEPYKLRHLRYVVDKVSQDPISTEMLEVSGDEVMELLNIDPGPKVGDILNILLGEVLDNPEKNNKGYLTRKIKELGELSDKEIEKKAEQAKEKRNEIKMKRDEMLKEKYWVQ